MNQNPFNIVGSSNIPAGKGEAIQEENTSAELSERIKALLASSDVLLFMKGTPEFPQCGFSANAIGILTTVGAHFKTFDILSDMDIRQGVKDFANWPTYPQLWVKGELVGGNDVITELFEDKELTEVLGL